MQIELPNDLINRLKQLAKSTRKPINELAIAYLRDSLADPLARLPEQEQAELRAYQHLSDETLVTIAKETFAADSATRLQELMDLHNFGKLSADQIKELEQLVLRSDQLMVRKAEALSILNTRGHTYTFSNLS